MSDGAQQTVLLPAATVTASPRINSGLGGPSIPNLKLKITPQATLPPSLAPRNVKGSAVEDAFKVVAPTDARIVVGCQVDTNALFGVGSHAGAEVHRLAVERAVYEWIVVNKNHLALDRIVFQPEPLQQPQPQSEEDSWSAPLEVASGLIVSPLAGLASHSPLVRHLIPYGEPVAQLRRLDIEIWWTYPPKTTKRPARSLPEEPHGSIGDRNEPEIDHATQVLGVPEGAGSHGARTLRPGAGGTEAETWPDLKAELLYQVGHGMKHVLRKHMICRYPFIFDPDFLTALLTATGHLLSLSAIHKTPLLSATRSLLESTLAINDTTLASTIQRISELPAFKTAKRHKPNTPSSDMPSTLVSTTPAESLGELYLHRLRAGRDERSIEFQVPSALSESLASLGVAKWTCARKSGKGKMSPTKVSVVEVSHVRDEGDVVIIDGTDTARTVSADHVLERMEVAGGTDASAPAETGTGLRLSAPCLRLAPRAFPSSLPDNDDDDFADDMDDAWDSGEEDAIMTPTFGSPNGSFGHFQHPPRQYDNGWNQLGLSGLHGGDGGSLDFDGSDEGDEWDPRRAAHGLLSPAPTTGGFGDDDLEVDDGGLDVWRPAQRICARGPERPASSPGPPEPTTTDLDVRVSSPVWSDCDLDLDTPAEGGGWEPCALTPAGVGLPLSSDLGAFGTWGHLRDHSFGP